MSIDKVPRLLVVEDDPDTISLIREALADHFGSDRVTHVDRLAGVADQNLDAFDLVLSDMYLPDGTGLDLLRQLQRRRPDLPVVMVTSESLLDTAMFAIRQGAYDYIVKTGDYLFTIPLIVEKNLTIWQTKQENARLHRELTARLEEINDKNRQLEDAVARLREAALTDPLTGLANRRHIQQQLERMFAEAVRYRSDLACLMIDLDRFKEFNDSLGHQTGDRLLRSTADVLRANCRSCDAAGRYGGDEFVILLPRTDPKMAAAVAERVRDEFRLAARAVLDQEAGCDMSVGIACVSLHRPTNADQLVALADTSLYIAKDQGKGRIVMASAGTALPGPPTPGAPGGGVRRVRDPSPQRSAN